MGNTGLPSKGCHTCRRRRVKWEVHVKPLVISQFTIVTSQGARVYGSVDFLPQLLEHADTKSTLYAACSAIASAYFANRTRSDSIGFGHRKLYGKALRSLSNDVANVEMQKQDSTLATMWLLCLYELIAGAPAQESKLQPQGWEVHGKAMIGLLQLRGQKQFQTSRGRLLFQLAYQTIHDELLCLRESSITHLQDIADHVLASLPLLMPAEAASADKQGRNIPTWGHALKLLWPLRLISSSAVVHEEQRAAADLGLLRMGYEAGIMHALGAYHYK
ncbi:hypothetical protein BBP40_005162 [Aspergillus hancockii]|nr:hypothetical protein BBP40_005162 [Aspergillus hancockii]